MKKFFCLVLCFLPISTQALSQIITGGVKYDINQARQELQTDLPDIKISKTEIYDINRIENITSLLKGITELKDRTLAYFSDGSYGIIYKNKPLEVLYYTPDGILTHKELKNSQQYPYKAYKFDIRGNLVNMNLRTSENETFIFNTKGKLIAHWIGKYCYDKDDNIIMTREIKK